jgi:hypothetical protein
MEKKRRTLFVKPTRLVGLPVTFNSQLVSRNLCNETETSLTLDTNILIGMENVVRSGNKWSFVKAQGLHNFVRILQGCPTRSACLSPGLALREMPPELAEYSRNCYELFCAAHLPGYVDAENAVQVSYQGKSKDYGFLDLSHSEQAALAIPFISLLFINLLFHDASRSRLEKFTQFLDWLLEFVDVLSLTEIEIARYCFAEPIPHAGSVRGKIRKNFVKTKERKLPKTTDEVLKIAFNGACDLRLIYACNAIDNNGLDGVKQDAWIATQDEKLVEFCTVFRHVNIDGQAGKYVEHTLLDADENEPYWWQTDVELKSRMLPRHRYIESIEIDADKLVDAATRAIEKVQSEFKL